MLEVRDVTAGYGEVEVLHGVTLDVKESEIVALLGSNGAGKSTLNNTVSGIVPSSAGSVAFEGWPVTGAASDAIVDKGIIQVPEGRRVFPNMTVKENLELGAYRPRRNSKIARSRMAIHTLQPGHSSCPNSRFEAEPQ